MSIITMPNSPIFIDRNKQPPSLSPFKSVTVPHVFTSKTLEMQEGCEMGSICICMCFRPGRGFSRHYTDLSQAQDYHSVIHHVYFI